MKPRLVANGLTEENKQVVIVFPQEEEIKDIRSETSRMSKDNVNLNYYFVKTEEGNKKGRRRRKRKKNQNVS